MLSLNTFTTFGWMFLPLVLLGVACGPAEEADSTEFASSSEGGFSLFSGDEWVNTVDQSFNLPIYREKIPGDWQLHHQIATNLQEGGYQYYLRDVYGPQGELLRDFGNATYNSYFGITLDRIIEQAAGSVVERPEFQMAQPSRFMEDLTEVREKAKVYQSQGMQLQNFEMRFRGQHEGQAMEGILYIMHLPFPQMQGAGFVEIEMVVAPVERFAAAREQGEQILQSREWYAEYNQKKNQHTQLAMQRNGQAHRNRMAQNQANFNAHQRRMQDLYAASDARHESFMNNLRSTPTSPSGSGYSSHDAFVDQIHEQTTFMDPYSGQEIQQSGQYDYWYTDGLGHYHGTNDPSFNPHSLQGDWQAIQPQRP